jgi:hypothetical protein
VRAGLLAAFAAGQGPAADAAYSLGAWLMHKTGVSRGAAAGLAGWARRAAAHLLVAALAGGDVLSESVARNVCRWTGRLPAGCRQAAGEILVAAAGAGADEEDLARLAAGMIAWAQPAGDGEGRGSSGDRSVRLEATSGGAGCCGVS